MKRLLFVALVAATVPSCGAAAPAAREYPPMPGSSAALEETLAVREVVREPLRDAPLVIEQRSESAVVTIRIVFDAGSADDPVGREGLTALSAFLMTEGGSGDLSYAEVTDRLFPMAATLAAQVGRDQTVFFGRVHRDRLDELWGLMRDALTRPRDEEADFERVRNTMVSDLTLGLRGNDDEELGKAVLQAMLYEGHPYAHPELGMETALGAISRVDVREHRSHVFCPGRMTIGLAGGYPDGFATRIAADLAPLATDACLGRAALPEPPDPGARIWIVDKPDASATAVSMGFTLDVERGDPDYAALVLALSWLGQHRQFVGRLMQNIREVRGMNYGDYAYPEHFEQDGWGTFPLPNVARRDQYFSIWLRPLRPEQAHFGIRLAIAELRAMVENGLTEEDVTRIRGYLEGYYALFLQTESRRLGYAIDDTFYGEEVAWLDALRTRWATLTAADVNAAIRAHLDPSRLQIAIIGPDGAGLAGALGTELISPMTYAEGTSIPPEVIENDHVVESLRIGIPRDHITVIPVADVFR